MLLANEMRRPSFWSLLAQNGRNVNKPARALHGRRRVSRSHHRRAARDAKIADNAAATDTRQKPPRGKVKAATMPRNVSGIQQPVENKPVRGGLFGRKVAKGSPSKSDDSWDNEVRRGKKSSLFRRIVEHFERMSVANAVPTTAAKTAREEALQGVEISKRFADRPSMGSSELSDEEASAPRTGRLQRKHRSIGPRLSVDVLRRGDGYSGRRVRSSMSGNGGTAKKETVNGVLQDDQYVTFITSDS